MICVNCGHRQDSGNFCGKCGTKFESTSLQTGTKIDQSQQIAARTKPIEPNIHVENMKEKSKLYFTYFTQFLKKPSQVYNRGEVEFTNGLTSIILLALLLGLSFSSVIVSAGLYGPGFFSSFGGMLFFSLATMGLVIVSLWLINTFFGPQHSFKAIISLYGGHLSPILLLGLLSLLLMLIKSFTFGSLTFLLTLMITISLLPLYLISVLLTKKSSSVDPFYGYIIYIATFSIFFMILTIILADSTIGILLKEFQYFF